MTEYERTYHTGENCEEVQAKCPDVFWSAAINVIILHGHETGNYHEEFSPSLALPLPLSTAV